MNNLRKALQKINHACGDCGGDGWMFSKEELEKGNPCIKIDCKTCSGTGIVIPLEFGCEVKVQLDEKEIATQVVQWIDESQYELGIIVECEEYEVSVIPTVDFMTVLGKPSTLQDLMRALGAKDNQTTMFIDNGYLMILTDDLKRTWTKLDLSKTVETQTQEVTNQLIKILS